MRKQQAYKANDRSDLIRLAAWLRSMHPRAKVYFLANAFTEWRLLISPWWLRALINLGTWWSRKSPLDVYLAILSESNTQLAVDAMEQLIEHMLNGEEVNAAGGYSQAEIDTIATGSFLLDYRVSKGYLK